MSRLTLDVGSGLAPWDPANARVIHVDTQRASLLDARATAFALPFDDETFDHVVARQVVEHIPTATTSQGEDPFYRFFDEIWRVLQPFGTLHVETPHARSPNAFADPTHRRFFVPRTFEPLWDPTRDANYPRRRWVLLGLRTRRDYPHRLFVTEHYPKLDALAQFFRLGTVGDIVFDVGKWPF